MMPLGDDDIKYDLDTVPTQALWQEITRRFDYAALLTCRRMIGTTGETNVMLSPDPVGALGLLEYGIGLAKAGMIHNRLVQGGGDA
jgi:hypothetical protein